MVLLRETIYIFREIDNLCLRLAANYPSEDKP
jgi:hypothetical protein